MSSRSLRAVSGPADRHLLRDFPSPELAVHYGSWNLGAALEHVKSDLDEWDKTHEVLVQSINGDLPRSLVYTY